MSKRVSKRREFACDLCNYTDKHGHGPRHMKEAHPLALAMRERCKALDLLLQKVLLRQSLYLWQDNSVI